MGIGAASLNPSPRPQFRRGWHPTWVGYEPVRFKRVEAMSADQAWRAVVGRCESRSITLVKGSRNIASAMGVSVQRATLLRRLFDFVGIAQDVPGVYNLEPFESRIPRETVSEAEEVSVFGADSPYSKYWCCYQDGDDQNDPAKFYLEGDAESFSRALGADPRECSFYVATRYPITAGDNQFLTSSLRDSVSPRVLDDLEIWGSRHQNSRFADYFVQSGSPFVTTERNNNFYIGGTLSSSGVTKYVGPMGDWVPAMPPPVAFLVEGMRSTLRSEATKQATGCLSALDEVFTAPALAAAMGISRQKVYAHIERLQAAGQIERVSRGRYRAWSDEPAAVAKNSEVPRSTSKCPDPSAAATSTTEDSRLDLGGDGEREIPDRESAVNPKTPCCPE